MIYIVQRDTQQAEESGTGSDSGGLALLNL